MKTFGKIIFIFIFVAIIHVANAQSGGPPMLTDDPGIVDLHKWEINTSILSSVTTSHVELSIPFIDINYGVARNLQLKVEAPYLVEINKNRLTGEPGQVVAGVKFRFLDEEKCFISAGTYPQLTLNAEKGFLLPLLLEKTIGKFLIGEDIGYFFGKNNDNNIQLGSLLGYQVTPTFQAMAEYFIQKNAVWRSGTNGFINLGFRQTLNKTFTLLGSFGTQLSVAPGEEKQYFFSFLGIQSSF